MKQATYTYQVWRYVDGNANDPYITEDEITLKANAIVRDVVLALKRCGTLKRNLQHKFFRLEGEIGSHGHTLYLHHAKYGQLIELRQIPNSKFWRYFGSSYDPAANVVCARCAAEMNHTTNRIAIVGEKDRYCRVCQKECNDW